MTTFEYIRKGFANKEWGGRIIHWIDYRYYFQTLDFGLMDDGRYYFDAIKADEELKDATLFEERLREVACGIVAEYIYNEHEKTPKQIFEDYYNACFESYKGRKIHDIELMLKPDDEIELAFVKDMISDEKRRIEASKAIDEYMTDEEKETLAQVGSCFMEYLQNKLNKIKPKHEQPDTPTNSPSAKEDNENKTQKGIIDRESLKSLFVDLFFADDYDIQDTHNKSIRLSRYDKFCQRLEMVLTDTDNKPTQTNIGEIAYMIYYSPFTREEYHKPKRTGEKGRFSNLINTFFDIVGKDRPSDTHTNKYKPKDEDGMKLYFGDILKWE